MGRRRRGESGEIRLCGGEGRCASTAELLSLSLSLSTTFSYLLKGEEAGGGAGGAGGVAPIGNHLQSVVDVVRGYRSIFFRSNEPHCLSLERGVGVKVKKGEGVHTVQYYHSGEKGDPPKHTYTHTRVSGGLAKRTGDGGGRRHDSSQLSNCCLNHYHHRPHTSPPEWGGRKGTPFPSG